MFVRKVFSAGVAAVCCSFFLPGAVSAADVSVNLSDELMTVEGYGAFSTMPRLYQKAGSVFWVDRPLSHEYDRIIKDLGASAIRFEISPDNYPVQGQPYDWTAGVFGSGSTKAQLAEMREYIARGCNRFIGTVWSPPCWMKYNKECTNGGVLDPANHEEFATYLADFCQMIKDSVGVDLYGISIQNEPQFTQPYNSAIMGDAAMTDVMNRLTTKLVAKGLTTRNFGAEHMFWAGIGPYTQLVASPNLHAFSVHGYSDGVAQDYGTAADWANLKNAVGSKKLWMTETTGGYPTLQTAKYLHSAFTSGKVSLWTWWAYADNLGTYTVTNNINTAWTPSGTYYASKHYFRFARPDGKMVGVTSSNAGLWASAFKNPDNSVAVVMINTTGSAISVNLTGAGLPTSYHVYQSAGTQNCALVGTTTGSGLSIPANGVVSIISGDPIPDIGADPIPNTVSAPEPSSTIGELNIHGDDVLELYLNGNKVDMAGNKSKAVSLVQGENIMAAKLTNTGWGGGLIGAMLLPGGDTLRTDGTWKLNYKEPTGNWTQLAYDDASWTTPHVFGKVDVWPGYAGWGTSAVNFYFWDARWICGATKTYFRKQIDMGSGSKEMRIKGNNFRFKLYVNGEEKGSGGPFTSIDLSYQSLFITGAGTMCIGLEITDAATDGNGVLMTSTIATAGGITAIDTTWKCWFEEQAGWNQMGFNDAEWVHPNVIEAYDPAMLINSPTVKSKYIYPGRFWFRKVFSSQGSSIIPLSKLLPIDRAVKSIDYFTVNGQKVDVSKIQNLQKLNNTIILQRVTYKNGEKAVSKVVKVK